MNSEVRLTLPAFVTDIFSLPSKQVQEKSLLRTKMDIPQSSA
jgi:hypothetical protein